MNFSARERELTDAIAQHASELRRIHQAAEGRDLNPGEQARWDSHESAVKIAEGDLARLRADRELQRAAVQDAASNGRGFPADGARDFQHQRHVEPFQGDDVLALRDGEARALRSLKQLERGMNIVTDADGGYGVPVLIDPTILVSGQGSLNPLRRLATTKTITTDKWRGVSSAGVTWVFQTEGAASNDISPTLAQPEITAHKAQGFIPFTIEVGMDYPDFSGEMSKLLAIGYDELLADKLSGGSGSTEPWGVFTRLDATAGSEVVVTTDGTFSGTDIDKVWTDLPDRWKGTATWFMSYSVGSQVATFGNGADLAAFMTSDLTGIVTTLRQRPVAYGSYAPDWSGTTGAANILIVGDFSNFYVAQRAGMNVEVVQHLFDTTTGTPTGQRGLYAWARVGSDVVIPEGLRLLQNQ